MRRNKIQVSSGTYCKALAQLERRITSQMPLTKAESDCVEAIAFGALAWCDEAAVAVFFLRCAISSVFWDFFCQLLFCRFNLLNAGVGFGQVLGHGAAQLLNGLPHLATYFKVRLIGLGFTMHLIPT